MAEYIIQEMWKYASSVAEVKCTEGGEDGGREKRGERLHDCPQR